MEGRFWLLCSSGLLVQVAVATVVTTLLDAGWAAWLVASVALTGVVRAWPMTAAAVALTVTVVLKLPPGARAPVVAAPRTDGRVKLVVLPVSVPTARVKVELLQAAVSLLLTVRG